MTPENWALWAISKEGREAMDRRQIARLVLEAVREWPDDGRTGERFQKCFGRATQGMADEGVSYWTLRDRGQA
jgi:hypothetical protein